MNALKVLTIATLTPPATTPKERTTALAKTDTPEMDKSAEVCLMSVYTLFVFADAMHLVCVSQTSMTMTKGLAREPRQACS